IKENLSLILLTDHLPHRILYNARVLTKLTRGNEKQISPSGEEFNYLYGIITTATEWYLLLYTSEGISSTSETEYHISLIKDIASEENAAELCKYVKRVMEVIVGLLKD